MPTKCASLSQPEAHFVIQLILKNFIVELNLMNGSVGTIKEIVYETIDGPDKENALPEETFAVGLKTVGLLAGGDVVSQC